MQDFAMQIDPTPLARGNATLRISLFAGMADLAG